MLGLFTVLVMGLLTVNHFGDEFIQEYWMNRIYNDLSRHYAIISITVTFIWALLVTIFIYRLGKSAAENELLTINKEKENEKPYSPSQCD